MASYKNIQDRVKHIFQEILESPVGHSKFKRIMASVRKPEIYLAYFKEAADRGYGKSTQYIEIENVGDDLTAEELIRLRESVVANRPEVRVDQIQ